MNAKVEVAGASAPWGRVQNPALPKHDAPKYDLRRYELRDTAQIMTPALLIYRDLVSANIATTLRLLNGEARRWRPHVKTTKLGYVMHMLTSAGVTAFKCATSLELLTAIRAGAKDVLVAYPLMGANARRLRAIAAQHPQVTISVVVDRAAQIEHWRGTGIGVFIDINPGMNRTGVEDDRTSEIVDLAKEIGHSELEFRGLHYYDGHLGSFELVERTRLAHAGYDRLMSIVTALQAGGAEVQETITAGTPAFPCSLSYAGFRSAGSTVLHSVSPGTLVYCDAMAMRQLPVEFGYAPAVAVLSQVVSRPTARLVTCDAGHKTVSADTGTPNCVVVGKQSLEPLRSSEEHLPIHVPVNVSCPEPGDLLYLIPQHVCPTVNNFDGALIIADGEVVGIEKVDARGREGPLLPSA